MVIKHKVSENNREFLPLLPLINVKMLIFVVLRLFSGASRGFKVIRVIRVCNVAGLGILIIWLMGLLGLMGLMGILGVLGGG